MNAKTEPLKESAPAATAPDELAKLALDPANAAEVPATPPPPEKPAASAETREVLKLVLMPAFNVLAPNWRVQAAEIDQLAEAYGTVIDKYFPGGISTIGPELGALLTTLAIIGPRMAMRVPPKLAPKSEKPNEEKASADAPAA